LSIRSVAHNHDLMPLHHAPDQFKGFLWFNNGFFSLSMLYCLSSQVAKDDGSVLLSPAFFGMEQWP